jgi:hypothetical protein
LKDFKTLSLLTISILILGVFPSKEQGVPVNTQDFNVRGVSTDNSTTDCNVSLLLNGITPYVEATPMGQSGENDFSSWQLKFDSDLRLNVGENKLTAKLLCLDDTNDQITKYHSVNFTGTNESIPNTTTEVLNTPSVRDNISSASATEIIESESTSTDQGDESELIREDEVVRNTPSIRDNISSASASEIIESESTSTDQGDESELIREDEVVRNITSGPVIVPPDNRKDSSVIDSSAGNDFVIIPNATKSSSASNNGTSTSMVIPPDDSKDSSVIDSSAGNDFVIIPNATQSDSASNNGTSTSITIPPKENGSLINQSFDETNLVSKEPGVQPKSGVEENGNFPLIFPTPSPRVTSFDEIRDDSLSDKVYPDAHTLNNVENNNTNLVSNISSIGSNTSSGIPNQTVSGSLDEPTNIEIPKSSKSNFSESTSPPITSSSEADKVSTQENENNPSIRALAGVDQIVNEDMEVILNGDTTYAPDTQLSYQWKQVGGDVDVFLGQQDTKQISFQAPEVDRDSILTFRFIVFDDGRQISSDDVAVTIQNGNDDDNDNDDDDNDDNDNSH